jgi:hypothetical protein
MQYKKIIVGGCSFTEDYSWAHFLLDFCCQNNYGIDYTNTALAAQGNDLIQKKCLQELTESLKKYRGDEIAVFVMWSGTERKAYYLDNLEIINRDDKAILKDQHRFLDLKNRVNGKGGWLLTNALGLNSHIVYNTNVTLALNDNHFVHNTLENMILLQSMCKLYGVKLYQNFYMTYVHDLIENNKTDELVSYLYQHLDPKTFVDNENIIYEFLQKQNNSNLLRPDQHPTLNGYKLWFNSILLPKLLNDGFFNG